MAKRPGPRGSTANLLKDYGPAVASVIAVIISLAAYLQTMRVQADADARERVRAEIYFEGVAPLEWCPQARTPQALADCGMQIKPADPAMRPLRIIVQYPASEFPDGRRTYDEGYAGNLAISLSKRGEFLAERIRRIHKLNDDKTPRIGVIPLTIVSNYTYNGRKYWDVSAYNLHYTISWSEGRRVVLPARLTYCGRLREGWPTFLVDPWLPTVIGFSDEKSTALLFECMGQATSFKLERGRYAIVSDLAANVIASPPPPTSIPYDVRSFTSAPVGNPTPLRANQYQLE